MVLYLLNNFQNAYVSLIIHVKLLRNHIFKHNYSKKSSKLYNFCHTVNFNEIVSALGLNIMQNIIILLTISNFTAINLCKIS